MADDAAPATLVLLHGHDDDPAEAAAVAADLAPRGWSVGVPEGPVEVGGRRAWWTDGEDGPVAAEVHAALAALDAVIDAAAGAVTVVGFSQGAALALLWALRRDAAATGGRPRADRLIALAGWLPIVDGLDLDPANCRAARLLVVHGAGDEVVPLPMGRSAARWLERNGIDVTFVERDAGHDLVVLAEAARPWLAT